MPHMRLIAVGLICLSLTGCGLEITLPPEALPLVQSLGALSPTNEDDRAELREPEPQSPLTNFHELEPGLFRGARPGPEGVKRLAAMGVKTIVNFEGPMAKKHWQAEKQLAESLGIRFIHMPMRLIRTPQMDQVQEFHRIAQDPKNRPLYFHCKLGEDRTGTMAYTYRVTVQHWPPEKAWQEMNANGFNHVWVSLRAYVAWYGRKFGRPQ